MRAPRILLIAVEGDTHPGLRRRLRRRGCELFEAPTEGEALERGTEIEPDLVVEEHALAWPHRRGAFHEILSAIRMLAGPLPGRQRRRAHAGDREAWRASAWHRPVTTRHTRHRQG